MLMKDLRPASALVQRFGVKMVMSGGPGSGKTPLINTAPRPVLCAVEPGLLSMRGSSVPVWEAYTPERLEEFFVWAMNSNEARNFDTFGFDSASQMAEMILTQEAKRNADGRQAYGKMSVRMMKYLNDLYFLQNKHIYMITKECSAEVGTRTVKEEGVFKIEVVTQKRSYFPGKDLDTKVPHLFDEVLHLGQAVIPGVQGNVTAVRTRECPAIFARDRSGRLDELEYPNLTAIFNKCMAA